MLDAAEAMGRFTSGKERADLDDEVLFWALVAQVAMLGEAASRVTEEGRQRYSEDPWREIIAMRNQLAHGSWSIDPDQLWRTINRDIPVLMEALRRPTT